MLEQVGAPPQVRAGRADQLGLEPPRETRRGRSGAACSACAWAATRARFRLASASASSVDLFSLFSP